MNCPNCGATVAPGISRCVKCGSFVEVSAPQMTPQTQGQYVQPAPQPVQPVGPAVKSKMAAGLFGIFLGALGIHRFYLGYVGIGVAQVLMTAVGSWFTCGLSAMAAGIWGLIEGILILTGSINRDAQGRPLKD